MSLDDDHDDGPAHGGDSDAPRHDGRPLRVVLCPVNTAGVPWTTAQALRRRGVDAKLVVFERYALHPEADLSLDRSGGFARRQATQWRAFAGLLPQTDVFHFIFGLTLVPQSLQFPALRLFRKKSVMHYLGSDIRGKTPEQLAYGKKAGAEIVGSYDALRWVPEAEVIPPGIDLSRFEPAPPSDRARPVILHAPSSRRRKGTEHVIAAVEGLDADLEIVEGLHHDEAFERFRNADIVVDQLNAGWYGLFAIECMALGKPVVTFLHDEAVRRTEEAFGTTVPVVSATAETLREQLRPLVADAARAEAPGSGLTGLRRARPRPGADHRPPPRRLRSTLMALSGQLKRLGKHSAIYGLGGLVSRILAVLLLPLYTHYLSTSDYGQIETLIALVTVLTIVLQFGIGSAFFRFYFDADDHDGRRLVLRTSFWFTMTMATLGLVLLVAFATPIAEWLFDDASAANLVRASAVALWAQLNYMQLTNLFRVEERSVAFVLASLSNVLLTVGATLLLVVVLDKGPQGVIVGNFAGTLVVYLALLGYRREQLGLQLSWPLLRRMNHFGLPLVPSALFLWVTNFSDRFFLVKLTDTSEVGLYSVGVRIASAMVLLLTAFRMAWPAFAYSIKSDEEAKQTYAWVLTYLVVISTWIATALALLSPWLVAWLAAPGFASASRVVGPLAFAAVSFGGFIVLSIGIGRARRTQFNWVVTGVAAVVNVALNLALIPPYGMMGAAVATVAAYTVMFAGMAWWAQRIFPCPYQWRRVLTAAATGVALAALGKLLGAGLPLCAGLILAYPLALLPVGFYLPAERRRLRALVARA